MREIWIKTNQRATYVILAMLGVIMLLGLILLSGVVSNHWVAMTAGGAIAAFGAFGAFGCWKILKMPRLAYEAGELLVFLTPKSTPQRVPIEQVEVFFVGQSESKMPDEDSESKTVVVRLAEAAEEFAHREVHPDYGHWCDGYITIRGTWCEPIDKDLIHRLNGRLVEVHRERR